MPENNKTREKVVLDANIIEFTSEPLEGPDVENQHIYNATVEYPEGRISCIEECEVYDQALGFSVPYTEKTKIVPGTKVKVVRFVFDDQVGEKLCI